MALAITNVSVTTTTISFIANSVPAEYYKNWYYQVGTGAWKLISTSQSYRHNVTITGLSENTSYKIGIKARKSSDNYEYFSPTVTVTTAKSTTGPTVSASISAATATGFTINGSANYPCKTWQYQIDGGTWTSLSTTTSATSVSKAITGLTPATTYSVRVRATRTYNNVTGTSGTVNATTLGASTLNSVNTVTADAGTVSIVFNATVPSSSYSHNLRIRDGGISGDNVVAFTGLSITSGTNTLTLSSGQKSDLLAHFPNEKSFVGTFALQTISGGAQVGNQSAKDAIITTTEANSKPTFTGFTHSEENANVTAISPGEYVQSISNIKIICEEATAKNGSTIVEYGATIGGKTVKGSSRTINFGSVPVCGRDLPIKVYAKDSRAYVTEVEIQKTIWCYTKPEVLEWQARRKDSIGEQTALYVLGAIRTTVDDTKNGLLVAQYRLRPSGGTWGSWTTLSGMTNIGTVTPGRRGYQYDNDDWETLDADKAYICEVRFQDEFEEYSSSISFRVERGIPLVSFREDKIGINQPNPQAALDVVREIHMNGYPVFGFVGNLSNTENLNDFKANGLYVQRLNANAATARNYPEAIAGFLFVYAGSPDYALQIYHTYTNTKRYARTYYHLAGGTGWSAWKAIF